MVKQNRGNCRQLRYMRLACMCVCVCVFPHYLKKASEVEEEETEVLIKMKDCNNSPLLPL